MVWPGAVALWHSHAGPPYNPDASRAPHQLVGRPPLVHLYGTAGALGRRRGSAPRGSAPRRPCGPRWPAARALPGPRPRGRALGRHGALGPTVPPPTAFEREMLARAGYVARRADRQPQLPLTLRLDAQGGVHADTTLAAGGQSVRVRLERVDTLARRRPY